MRTPKYVPRVASARYRRYFTPGIREKNYYPKRFNVTIWGSIEIERIRNTVTIIYPIVWSIYNEKSNIYSVLHLAKVLWVRTLEDDGGGSHACEYIERCRG